MKNKEPKPGDTVVWQRFGGEWTRGTLLRLASGETKWEGDPFVAVLATNGVVHIRLSALSIPTYK